MAYRIKDLRRRAGLTQAELAKKANISRVTLIMIERDERSEPRVATLNKIAEALGKRTEELFLGPEV